MDNAYQEATILKSEKIGTEHILLAMLKDGECVATRILVTLNVRLDKVQEHILDTLGLDVKTYYEEGSEGGHVQGGMLDQFGTDLTMQAAEGKLDPVIGREEEIEQPRAYRRTGRWKNRGSGGPCEKNCGGHCAGTYERQAHLHPGSFRNGGRIEVSR